MMLTLLVCTLGPIGVNGAFADDTKAGTDKRGDASITVHAGMVIDNFASDSTKTYLNYNDANSTRNRAAFGFDMEYRLLGDGEKTLAKSENDFFTGQWNPQLWIYGHTLHGMRSAEVDCNANPTLSVCSNKVLAAPSANNNLYLLRNATSLEAHLGLRYEFLTLHAGGPSPASVYANGELGFLTVADHGGDVVDMHHAGLGAVIIGGPFINSFLEVGYGRTDLFLRHRVRRFKVIAKAVWSPLQQITGLMGASLFAKMVADTDLGTGADSIQTYLGVSCSLGRAF